MDDRRRTPSDGKSSLCLWQGELKSTKKYRLLDFVRKTITTQSKYFDSQGTQNQKHLHFKSMLNGVIGSFINTQCKIIELFKLADCWFLKER